MATTTVAAGKVKVYKLNHQPLPRGWVLDGDAIHKQYTFANFPQAIAFVDRLAPKAVADQVQDTPLGWGEDIRIRWSAARSARSARKL